MRQPNEDETLFIHPVTDEAWLLPLQAGPRYFSESTKAIPIEMSGISTFPPKETQNDWTRSDHPVLSSYVQSDTTGGGQILTVDEATDGSRYWFSTLETRYPRQVSLGRLFGNLFVIGAEVVIPLGDFGYEKFMFASIDEGGPTYKLRERGPDPLSTVTVGDLDARPLVTGGVYFAGSGGISRFFICVEGGYQIYDGTTLGSLIADVEPISLCKWDNKLYALQADGKIWESTSGDSASWVNIVTLDPSEYPVELVEFYDRSDEYALHVIARGGVWAVDWATPKLYKTKISVPYHPDSGRASAIFNTDLYISYGLGVKKYTGGSIIPTGLDRDFGLPAEFRGHIVSMCGTQDGVVALVSGPDTPGTDPGDPPPSLVMLWNEDGWHCLWAEYSSSSPSRICVSNNEDGTYRIYWGDRGALFSQDISFDQFNPLTRGDDWEFVDDGYIEYGDLDFAMSGQKKLIDSIEVRVRDITATETVTVKYALDGTFDYVTLGVINAQPDYGIVRLPLGANGTHLDGVTPRYDGVIANSIRVRLELARDSGIGVDTTVTPIVESMGVVYQKLMSPLRGFVFNVKGTDDTYNGKTMAEIQDFLLDMVTTGYKVPWWHRGEWRSVRLAGVSGWDLSGAGILGGREVSVVEVVDEFEYADMS